MKPLLLTTFLAACAWSQPKPAPPPPVCAPGAVPQAPEPLVAGAKVIALWPAGSPALRGCMQKETFRPTDGQPERIQKVFNVHNPSIELHLAPAAKANGAAIILAAGGGNTELNVGTEGTDIAAWLNDLGVHAFILRYRLPPYNSATDALADTQRSIRMLRANAKT